MLEDINLPSVTCEEKDKNKAIFTIKPLYPGYGMTVGNALRRVMLSSLPGASVVSIKANEVDHEFSTIPNIKEDMIEIILNLKQIKMKLQGNEKVTMEIKAKGEKVIKAGDIKTPSQIKIINPEVVIATLSKKAKFEAEIEVAKGRGYVPVEDREKEKEIGKILIDAVYTPIKKVRYAVNNVRVGKRTDFDQVVFEIETDGSITPRAAFAKGARYLVDHFNLFVDLDKTKTDSKKVKEKKLGSKDPAKGVSDGKDPKKLEVSEIGLSVRTERVLAENGIKTIAGLLRFTEKSLEEKEGVGKKAVQEVKNKLKKIKLSLKG